MTTNACPTRRGVLGGAAALAVGTVLGPGRAEASPAPEDAPAVAAGRGRVVTWGANFVGQLGRRAGGPRLPALVPGLDGVIRVAAGFRGSYAIRADGSLWSWGSLTGRGPSHDPVPTRVRGLPPIAAVSAYSVNALALARDGSVWAWGSNASGELGDGTVRGRPTPVRVVGLSDVTAVRTGDRFSLALTSDGHVFSWGEGVGGQLGHPVADAPRPHPELIPGLSGVRSVCAAFETAFAVLRDGSALAWGSGPLGNGDTGLSYSPVAVAGQVSAALEVTAGFRYALFLTSTHRIKGSGSNGLGQLGLGDAEDRLEPTLNPDLDQVVAVSTSFDISYALRRDGTVWAWGANDALGLGQPTPATPECSTVPLQVPGVTGVRGIAGGGGHALALL